MSGGRRKARDAMHVAGLNIVAHPPEAAIIAGVFRMTSTPPTLTYTAKVYGSHGNARRVSVSLPYIACLADDPHYAAPPPPPPPPGAPEPPVPKSLRPPR